MKTPDNHSVSSNVVIFPGGEQHTIRSQIAEVISRMMDEPQYEGFISTSSITRKDMVQQMSNGANIILKTLGYLQGYQENEKINIISGVLASQMTHDETISSDDSVIDDVYVDNKLNDMFDGVIDGVTKVYSDIDLDMQPLIELGHKISFDTNIILDTFVYLNQNNKNKNPSKKYSKNEILDIIGNVSDDYHNRVLRQLENQYNVTQENNLADDGIIDLLPPEVDDFIDGLVQKHQHEQTKISGVLRQIASTILWVFDELEEYDDELIVSVIYIILIKYYGYVGLNIADICQDNTSVDMKDSLMSRIDTYIAQILGTNGGSQVHDDMYLSATVIVDVFLTLQSEMGVVYDTDKMLEVIYTGLAEYGDNDIEKHNTIVVNDNIVSLGQTSGSLDLIVHDLLTQMSEERSIEKGGTEKEHYDDMKPNANFITQVLSYIEYFGESNDTFTNECIIATIADVMPCEYISGDASDIGVQEPDQELSYIRDKVHSSDLNRIMDDIDASARKIFLRDHPGCDIDHEHRNDTRHSMHYATNLILDVFENVSQNNGLVYDTDVILSVLRSGLEGYEKHLYKVIDDSPLETGI